jgi:hypothetical protein
VAKMVLFGSLCVRKFYEKSLRCRLCCTPSREENYKAGDVDQSV